jgi:hypothetical protein
MKRIMKVWMAIAALILLGASGVSAQSLGDYARAVRKKKPQAETATRHYDNDNLPTNEQLSVVGPETAAGAKGGQNTPNSQVRDPKAVEAERQQAADDLQRKMDTQKAKIDALNHELELDQREYRLRAASFYGDAGTRLRNSAQWSKDDGQYKSDMDSKQKAIDAARQQLTDLQEQARKAGMKEKESDGDKAKEQKE